MYLSWAEKTITDFDDESIEKMYDDGFVFTRIGKGVMNQTRSLRIDLNKFELSSENKRVLKKTEDLILSVSTIPYAKYDWSIHKFHQGDANVASIRVVFVGSLPSSNITR